MSYETKELFIAKPNKNVDTATIQEGLVVLQDFYMQKSEDGLSFKKRFGLSEVVNTGHNVQGDGLYWFDSIDAFIYVINGRIYKMAQNYALTDLTGDLLVTEQLVSFVEKSYGGINYLFMANGGNVVYTNGTALTQKIASITFNVSSIVNFNSYLIINRVGTNFWYYNLEGLSPGQTPFNWNLTQNIQAESNPDAIDALTVVNNRLYIWGKRSLETWYMDASALVPFANLQTSQVKEGVLSPYSIQVINKTQQVFLDENRRVRLLSEGRILELSKEYGRDIQAINNAIDSQAFYMSLEGKSFYVMNFPEANKTYLYDIDLNIWSELGYWESGTSTYSRFRGITYGYSPRWNKHFLMDYQNGKIYTISSAYKDDNGNTINAYIETGSRTHGSNVWKRSKNLRAYIKTGVGKYNNPTSSPYIRLTHADNGSNTFSSVVNIDLGNTTSTTDDEVILMRQGGRYRSRKYRIYAPDSTDIVIFGLFEEIEYGHV